MCHDQNVLFRTDSDAFITISNTYSLSSRSPFMLETSKATGGWWIGSHWYVCVERRDETELCLDLS